MQQRVFVYPVYMYYHPTGTTQTMLAVAFVNTLTQQVQAMWQSISLQMPLLYKFPQTKPNQEILLYTRSRRRN